jgi:hypothetical protein
MVRSLTERPRKHEQQKARLAEQEAKLKDAGRKARTRQLIEAGGLVEKVGLLDLESAALSSSSDQGIIAASTSSSAGKHLQERSPVDAGRNHAARTNQAPHPDRRRAALAARPRQLSHRTRDFGQRRPAGDGADLFPGLLVVGDPRNRRRNSTAAANSPSCSNTVRIAAVSASETTYITRTWRHRRGPASVGTIWFGGTMQPFACFPSVQHGRYGRRKCRRNPALC